ncbi:MAG: hypothetical protein M3Q58_05615 [Bacteroidota bacterium]|nr:hypothetical protein [Bacteroidota bacterium]
MKSLYQLSETGHNLVIESAVNVYVKEYINMHPERLSGLTVYGIHPGDILKWINKHPLCLAWTEDYRNSVIIAIEKVYTNYILVA